MKKEDMLRLIAEKAYDVGFGAKKHFASYDIVEKGPGLIGFLSFSTGISALVCEVMALKSISAILLIFGVAGMYISMKNSQKQNYIEAGKKLTELFHQLKSLYFRVKSDENFDSSKYEDELKEIDARFYATGMSDQLLLSDWYAHYKFFWQMQIDWIDEERKFRFFRDKLPLSFMASVVLSILVIAIIILNKYI